MEPIRIRRVLHVVEGRRDPCDPMAAVLSDLGLDVVTSTDVYGALACLHRSDRSRFGAVLVCVDYLAWGEFEFFALVRRLGDDLSVLAYSAANRGGRVGRAVSFGATGAVEAERASVAAALGDGDAVAEATPRDVGADSSESREGEAVDTESRASEAACGPLLTEEEISMLLYGGGEAGAAGRRKGIV